jgi:hypothetical protein
MSSVAAVLLACLCAEAGGRTRTVNVAVVRRSGEKTRGPATVTLTHVNVLRYDVVAGVSATYTAGPDLRVPFIPPIPAIAEARPAGGGEKGSEAGLPTVDSILARLAALDAERITKVQSAITLLIEKSAIAKRAIDALVDASDAALRTPGGPATLITGSTAAMALITPAVDSRWPTTDILAQVARLVRIRNDVGGLTGLTADQQKIKDYILERLTTLDQWYASVDPAGDRATAAGTAQARLATWNVILAAIKADSDPFTIADVSADCGFAFGGNKESKIELIKHDRTAAPGTAESREEIVTVVCSSPMSVSGGFGVSTIDNPTYAFVSTARTTTTSGQTTTTAISTFGLTENSTSRAVPLLLINTRLWEPNDVFSLHLSAGAAVDNAGAVGNSIEYVFGPSVAISRELFITAGWHFGYLPALIGGFKLGDPVPDGVSAPPLRKDRTKGAVLAISFRIR